MDIKNPEAGGAEVFTHEIAKRLVERGHEVTLFTRSFRGAEPLEILDGVQIVRGGGKYTVYRFARQYYEKNFRGKADVVIDEINTRPFMTVRFAEEPVIAIIHQLAREYWLYETPPPINYVGYHILENRWLRNYIEVPTITVSESTRQDLLELGFNEVFVVSLGLNFPPLDEVPEKESHPVIAYVGRLTKAKRPDHAVKAFKIVNEKVPAAELWIIGDGYFRNDLEKISNGLVRFYGGLSDIGRRELVKRAWVLVNPSVREGFGLNVIEANALGTPCIAYDVAGLRDSVKNNETGLLAKAGNVKDLADKIIILLINDVLREKLSRNALQISRRFKWDESTEVLLKIIKRSTGF